VGYDLADVALTRAAHNLKGLGCPVELCHGDLLDAVSTNSEQFDLIFTSFALHHLSSQDKVLFFRSACRRLTPGGILLLIDTVRKEGQERDSHLEDYWCWLRSECKTLSPEGLHLLGAHIRNYDFPETIASLNEMATFAGFSAAVEVSRFRWHHAYCFTLVDQRRPHRA
jgi:ubiquinone/menaquinone biosynthesis C-methylase UbiE